MEAMATPGGFELNAGWIAVFAEGGVVLFGAFALVTVMVTVRRRDCAAWRNACEEWLKSRPDVWSLEAIQAMRDLANEARSRDTESQALCGYVVLCVSAMALFSLLLLANVVGKAVAVSTISSVFAVGMVAPRFLGPRKPR